MNELQELTVQRCERPYTERTLQMRRVYTLQIICDGKVNTVAS